MTEERDGASIGRRCFVILPIGAPNSDVRTRSNHIFKYVISETLINLGYDVTRADEIDQSGLITTQIIENLLSADVVVADLSDLNANVFYELGVVHAFRTPFIHIMASGQNPPFDVQSMRTVFVNTQDLDSVHAAKTALVNMTRSIEANDEIETPIRQTINLQSLRESGNSESRAIADIAGDLATLTSVLTQQTRRAPRSVDTADYDAMRVCIEALSQEGSVRSEHLRSLQSKYTSKAHNHWASTLRIADDPWSSPPISGGYDDEPPF